jgi:hypothetical protein
MTETGFMNHRCPEHERLNQLRSPLGQRAYSYYAEWMRLKKRAVPPQETFLVSKQYNYFVKFAEWSDKTAIPNVPRFIELMVETDTQPVLWSRDSTYSLYLQWYDNAYPPEQQFIETLDALKKLAEEHGVALREIFPKLGAMELARLIRRRKLSPWLLIVAPTFLHWAQVLPQAERDMLGEAINFKAYADKIKARPDLTTELRAACEHETL